MTSLRMRIALLLVAAIVSVVGLATFTAIAVLREPGREGAIRPVARQLQLLASYAAADTASARGAGLEIRDRPAGGAEDERLTQAIARILREDGTASSAIITHLPDGSGKVASVQLPDERWMIVEVPDFAPPRGAWVVLSGWIALIVIGATAVSLYFTAVLTRPLQLLQNAVERIGPDGVLAPLPEEGSGELRATARALNHLSARLKSAMESRMRLVAAAGHDLRTPMTRMRLRAEFLPEEEREKWLSDLEELDRIADSAIRLVREEVQQEDTREPVALSPLLGDLAADLAALKLPVRLIRLDDVSVKAGALSLQRALRNLIVNAATHGKGCTIDLVAGGDKATITIADNGPGIPPELLDKAFEPFFRVDPARRQSVPGAGLGLAIAKEIIERYGGKVTLANRQEGGLLQTVVFEAA